MCNSSLGTTMLFFSTIRDSHISGYIAWNYTKINIQNMYYRIMHSFLFFPSYFLNCKLPEIYLLELCEIQYTEDLSLESWFNFGVCTSKEVVAISVSWFLFRRISHFVMHEFSSNSLQEVHIIQTSIRWPSLTVQLKWIN